MLAIVVKTALLLFPCNRKRLEISWTLQLLEPSHLNATDTLACRSFEFFEVMSPDVVGESSSTDRPAVLQVRLRFAVCVESETTAEKLHFPCKHPVCWG
jgi:hypothetical protein